MMNQLPINQMIACLSAAPGNYISHSNKQDLDFSKSHNSLWNALQDPQQPNTNVHLGG